MTGAELVPHRHAVRERAVRTLLGVLALALIGAPFYAVGRYEAFRRAVAEQQGPPRAAAPQPAGRPGPPARDAGAGDTSPVVLAYHDIGRGGRSRYTVTPQAFDAQLAALAAAGYRSLSSEEFVAYLRGGRAPAPRSVFLTFDDGTHGLWVHADRILARYRMRAAAFLITGSVGKHRPYYLSWQEIGRMAKSGRWDFQDHTHSLHRRVQVDAAHRVAPALTGRLWLPRLERPETEREYRGRIERDLDRSVDEITRHGLPRPRLFAYPFSEAGHRAAPQSTERALRAVLDERFAAGLTNTSLRPMPAGRRAAAARQVQRIEVLGSTDARSLLTAVERWTSVSPAECPAPLTEGHLWRSNDGSQLTGSGVFTGAGPYPGRTGYAAASYRPTSSADWSHYTVDVRVGRLREALNSAGLVVRDGSLDPLEVSVSFSYVRLRELRNGRWYEIDRRTLTDATEHRVGLTVEGDRTVVVVDGRTRIERRSARATGGDATGGIALSVRSSGSGGWPRFVSLAVHPSAGGTGGGGADGRAVRPR
ncbi:polysaccharide deacetylase family protein [Streptomyces sp. NPDC005899]|uniref:polysaccharide deacetylase family protein n=1 Tax=Streptomyces sp. NPDC005899 TaxID=3155716 RepID=UPI0033F69FA5